MVTKVKPEITEKQFELQVKQMAELFGYIYYHTHRSQFSPSGWPDCVLARLEPTPRLIIAELKTNDLSNSQPSIDQYIWLEILQNIGPPVECYLWRCSDFEEIASILR